MTVGQWLGAAETRLRASDDMDAGVDAQWLVCEATGFARSALRLHADAALTAEQLDRLNAWLEKRASGEPLQYALGTAVFMGLTLKCDARALIPRPETELLADEAITRLKGVSRPDVLDLCCGTGAIGLSVAHSRPDARVTLSDISADALSLARENAALLGLKNVTIVQGDLFDASGGARYDAILCNPPYLTAADMAALQPEVRREPALALYGGEDGLGFYRRIAREATGYLKKGGFMILEVGQGQAEAVTDMLGGFDGVETLPDLNGIGRIVCARKI